VQKQPLIYQLPGIPIIKMIHIEGGTFIMGDESDINNPAYEVRLDDFYLCEFPVTQDLYQALTQKNPSEFNGSRHPVEMVSWYDAVEFCNLLCKELGLEKVYSIDKETKDKDNTSGFDEIKWLVKTNNKAKGFRLPTEAEWEYAARGGAISNPTTYAGSNRLEQVGWFRKNSGNETLEVGLKFPNQLGFYDMNGNVLEWCWDWYRDYNQKDRNNPKGTKSGSGRVYRGGGWSGDAGFCRVVFRNHLGPDYRLNGIGFRIALSLPR